MEKEMLLAELTKNCNGKREKLMNLLKNYELAELGREVWEQRFKDIENRVLSEQVFLCAEEISRSELKIGDRITDAKWDYLLSEEDIDRLQSAMIPYYVKEGLTDENGYYTENWDKIVCDARCELVDYMIDEIVPKTFRDLFWQNRKSIVFQKKLIDAFKDSVKTAA